MRQKKCLKELTIKDNFMFGAVMSDAENCRRFLEMAAGFSIERVEVIKEKSMVYHPEYKVCAWMYLRVMKKIRITMWRCRCCRRQS